MNIVYLIGNGFDLKLGLKTSYKAFYQWYENLSHAEQNSSIISFIKHVREKEQVDDRWSDMELALGKYTTGFKSADSVEEAKTFHDNLVEAISNFIKSQEINLPIFDNIDTLINRYFISPEGDGRLLEEEKNELISYRNIWSNTNPWRIKIISFNYTNSVEKLLKYENGKILGNYYKNDNGKNVIDDIEHIHGYVDNRLILGVNDVLQIDNTILHSTDAMNWYIKENYNNLCKLGHVAKCQDWINSSNLICVFGFSLGLTDKQWWELIVTWMLIESRCKLILFDYSPNMQFSSLKIARREEYKTSRKDFFLERSGVELNDNKKNNLKIEFILVITLICSNLTKMTKL